MKKIAPFLLAVLFSAGCSQPSEVKSSVYVAPSAGALTCCECLEQTGCLIRPQHALEKQCLHAIDAGEVPNYISSCLAGEPGSYPQGLCTDECTVLFE